MKHSDSDTTIEALKAVAHDFVKDRKWEKYHTARNLAESISIEASELLELFQWTLGGDEAPIGAEAAKLARMKEELGDVLIYCLCLANVAGIDVSRAVLDKVRKNEEKYPIERYKGSYSKPVKE